MASSNRHWPSMFKSKPCNPHHQWQQEINPSSLLSTACQKPPYSSGVGGEERSPEPKPRWNPKPEQIRILEAIFNSGMVNPPRDEIRRIRVQLQEYGQVGDANVFYWFQNRKSRSKHKQRQLQSRQNQSKSTALASSTSSSTNSSGSDKTPTGIRTFHPSKTTLSPNKPPANTSNSSPTTSVNQTTLFPSPQDLTGGPTLLFPGLGGTETDPCVGLWTELINQGRRKESIQTSDTKGNMELHPVYGIPTTTTISTTSEVVATNTTINSLTIKGSNNNTLVGPFTDILQGVGGVPARMVVFINDVAFDVGMGPLNVREAFGGEAVLLHSTGLPVLVDDWGVTIQPLHHGGSYYLI